jgi:DNA (cytosine-5)-methyltransferase 1
MDLGLERAGMECVAQVEIDEFCQKVLTKHWPDVPKFKDVRDVGKENLPAADLIAGGFPCQPFSVAGKRKGTADDRHLWPEMFRVISELKPTWVIGENVPGIIPIFLDQAISDLEAEGYTCEAYVLPACAFDAPHRRDRLFVLANSSNIRRLQCEQPKNGHESQKAQCKFDSYRSESRFIPDPNQQRLSARDEQEVFREKEKTLAGCEFAGTHPAQNWRLLTVEPTICGMVDGVPDRVDRLKSLGNAVVPQVAEFIGRMIMEANEQAFIN